MSNNLPIKTVKIRTAASPHAQIARAFVRRYYQREDTWYAVYRFYHSGIEADIHVALS